MARSSTSSWRSGAPRRRSPAAGFLPCDHVVMSNRPASSEGRYIDLVPEEDVLSALEKQTQETEKILRTINEQKSAYRYAPEKWSIKTMLRHITDTERIFGYRI